MPDMRISKRFRYWQPGEIVPGIPADAAAAWADLGVAEYVNQIDVPIPKPLHESAVDGLAVRIVSPFDIFEPGETLPGVERATAEAWVSRGVAEYIKPAEKAPARAGRKG